MATCVRCNTEFELVSEWSTIIEEAGERLTLIYTSVVCDDCLTESEIAHRAEWNPGDPVDPALMALGPAPERLVT